MAGEPAIRKVLVALEAWLQAIPALGRVDIDRPEDRPYGNAELPAVNILHTGTSFELRSHAERLHRAAISLDMIVASKASGSNSAQIDELEAVLIERLWANRTLGGLVEDIAPQSSEGNEQVRADEGARLLTLEIIFLTPIGNHRTIIGASGLIP